MGFRAGPFSWASLPRTLQDIPGKGQAKDPADVVQGHPDLEAFGWACAQCISLAQPPALGELEWNGVCTVHFAGATSSFTGARMDQFHIQCSTRSCRACRLWNRLGELDIMLNCDPRFCSRQEADKVVQSGCCGPLDSHKTDQNKTYRHLHMGWRQLRFQWGCLTRAKKGWD